MTRRHWRLRALLAVAAAAGSSILLAFACLIALRASRDTGTGLPGDVIRRSFLLWAALLVPASAAAGWWLGQALATPFRDLRRALLAHIRPEPERPLLESRIAEGHELAEAAAAALLAAGRGTAPVEAQRAALSSLVESAGEGLLRVEPGGRIGFANPAARTLLGLPDDTRDLVFPALVRNVQLRQVVARALTGEAVNGVEIGFGRQRLLLSARPLRGGAGGAVIAIADLTALRRLEGVRRDFVANVSHELKTPLTSIRGYVETLLHEELEPEARREFLEIVHRNAERLQHLVDDLLDLSRIESGGWQPELRALPAAEAVRDAWQSCEDRARQRGLNFEPPAAAAIVLADPGALRQVLGNLFDNALRYTPDGGTIAVTLAHDPPPASPGPGTDWVHFRVSDTGAGIPRAALPRVFERFYRVDPARSRAEGGTGLGLAIVKHLVESMGGHVQADSTVGRGTTIHVWLRAGGG